MSRMCVCNLNTKGAEAGESQVTCQAVAHNKILYEKNSRMKGGREERKEKKEGIKTRIS